MENATFTAQELKIMQILVDRSHTRNMETGRGNSADMNSLLRKLNELTKEGGDNA